MRAWMIATTRDALGRRGPAAAGTLAGVAARRIAIRCDGGATLGAGHVARCRPLAAGLRGGGARSTFIGKLDGLAARLAQTAGLPLEAPADGPLGVDPARFDAAVVDLYDTDVCPLARALPVATPAEASHCEEAGVASTTTSTATPPRTGRDCSRARPTRLSIPPSPEHGGTAGRWAHVVTLGGSAAVHGRAPLPPRPRQPRRRSRGRNCVTTGLPAADGLEVERLPEQSTMLDAITRADIAITATGMTAYELACAGVPFLALVVAGSQERVGRAGTDRPGARA